MNNMNQKHENSAPSVLRIRTTNWDNMTPMKQTKPNERTFFVSGLTGHKPEKKTDPVISLLKSEIAQKRANRELVVKMREINQALGGGKIGAISILKNGAVQVNGKFIKKQKLSA